MHYLTSKTLAGMSNIGEIMATKVSYTDNFVQLSVVFNELYHIEDA